MFGLKNAANTKYETGLTKVNVQNVEKLVKSQFTFIFINVPAKSLAERGIQKELAGKELKCTF